MGIQRMDHIGVVVDDLAAATEFFTQLGLEPSGNGSVEGDWAGRIIGLEGVRSDIVFLRTPDGHGQLELSKFHSPPSQGDGGQPANTRGIRHVSFIVDDIDAVVASLRTRGVQLVGEVVQYEEAYRLCYVRGPEGILVELAEELGSSSP